MFERFGKEARQAVVEAQIVARSLHSPAIDSRHLVVALAEAGGRLRPALTRAGLSPDDVAVAARRDIAAGGLDAQALASIGVDLDAISERADAAFGDGALLRAGRGPGKGHLPFARDAKKSLELGLREAIRVGAKTIEAPHLLLGVLRDDGSPGARVLAAASADAGLGVSDLREVLEAT